MAKKKATKTESKAATKKRAKAAAPAKAKPAQEKSARKLSALAAAAKVLAESGAPMTAKGLIDAMASKGYWTSPGGQTPHATLYAAMIREINLPGVESRFVKVDRGQFTLNEGVKSTGSAK